VKSQRRGLKYALTIKWLLEKNLGDTLPTSESEFNLTKTFFIVNARFLVPRSDNCRIFSTGDADILRLEPRRCPRTRARTIYKNDLIEH
jgi:hypothetical protein